MQSQGKNHLTGPMPQNQVPEFANSHKHFSGYESTQPVRPIEAAESLSHRVWLAFRALVEERKVHLGVCTGILLRAALRRPLLEPRTATA